MRVSTSTKASMLACGSCRPRIHTTSVRDGSTVSGQPPRPEEPEQPKMGLFQTPVRSGGETTWRVPSLSVPDTKSTVRVIEIERCEGARLFLERARSFLPGFPLTDRNAAAVAQICQRLDGIPLAVELAAARVSALGVEQILTRL